jgi:acyl-CoA synthetase (AMP-forming)/AMP-acid ligase II
MAATPDVLSIHASANPDGTAVIEGGTRTTWRELNEEVNRLANGLVALGIRPRDRAVWCGPNAREVLVFIHAARKIGLVAVPLAYRFTAEEMQYVIDNSESVLVMIDAEQAEKVGRVRDQLPTVRQVVVYGGPAIEGAQAWANVLAAGAPTEPDLEVDNAALGATMIYTSGTTGKPKGALRTSSDPALVGALIEKLRMQPGTEVHVTTGPLYHSGPNAFAVLTHLLGGCVVIQRRFDAAEWVRLVEEHRCTSTFSAPTQLKRIVSLPDETLQKADLSSMRTFIANAAPVPYALKQEAIAKLGEGWLFEVYGSTELGVDTVLEPEDQLRKPGSCGKPYGGIELRIVGDDGSTLPAGEVGHVYIRTTLAMDGYHRTDERLDELTDSDAEWKSVGDMGYLDDEDYLYISDRKKDMIISGGMNIYPAEIEAVLHAHPDVMDVAVFGIPDEEWGEQVHAVVQAKPGREIDMADLESFAAEHLAGYKRPRSWEFRDELPRTEAGKLLKRVLRDEHWKGRGSKV